SGNGIASVNVLAGLALQNDLTGTLIAGNYIGLNAAGTAALGNLTYGIQNQGTGVVIGGTIPGMGNVISGNKSDGVLLVGNGGSTLRGNLIGTDPTGAVARPNLGSGVNVSSPDNTVGGTTAAARNVISGNATA